MSVRRRFTEEEDRVIFSKISENPGNISQCLRELSTELDRSYILPCDTGGIVPSLREII